MEIQEKKLVQKIEPWLTGFMWVMAAVFGTLPWVMGLLFVIVGWAAVTMMDWDWPVWTAYAAFVMGFPLGVWLELKSAGVKKLRRDINKPSD